jgi:molybdopterin-synthase adenylyltransferase
MEFDEKQIERYSRNIVLAELGVEGQRRLRAASVLVVGAGGLGSPVSLYLAAAGVGRLGLIDPDDVELSNLQRQVLHSTLSLGVSKAESAAASVLELNPDVEVEAVQGSLHAENALELVDRYDFVLDCTDNFAAKYLINDACVLAGKPFSHAGVLGFGGQAFTWEPSEGGHPCLRCLLPEQPSADESPNCAGSGVLGAAVGVLGSIQAAEAIKSVTEIGERLTGRVLSFDCLKMRFSSARFELDPSCPVCSENSRIVTLSADNYRH